MERKISLSLYGAAFLLSVAIFAAGMLIGQAIDRSSMEGISGEVAAVSQKVSSVQLLLLMDGNSSAMCPLYTSQLDGISAEVEATGHKLTYLEEEKHLQDDELKKQYFVLEAEAYVLSEKVRAICGDRSVLLINFYSNRGCARCREQGIEILKARDAVSPGTPVRLFSFDGDLGSPVAEAFEARYNVTAYPTVVINGRAHNGFLTQAQLEALLKGV